MLTSLELMKTLTCLSFWEFLNALLPRFLNPRLPLLGWLATIRKIIERHNKRSRLAMDAVVTW